MLTALLKQILKDLDMLNDSAEDDSLILDQIQILIMNYQDRLKIVENNREVVKCK